MKIDELTRQAICAAVERAVKQRMEMYDEVWLTSGQLIEQFGMFSKDWLKRYGHLVPRERLEVYDESAGKVIGSRWAYPKHRIQRWIADRGHKSLCV
jgi:hypothetical protein